MSGDWWKLGISAILALVPVIIWYRIIKKEKDPNYVRIFKWVFLGGCLSVLFIFVLQYFWQLTEHEDLLTFLRGSVSNETIGFVIMFTVLGALEEIVKIGVVRWVDASSRITIANINDAIRIGLITALGFAFAENSA